MKKFLFLLVLISLFLSIAVPISASEETNKLEIKAKSAILMDATTGTVLYEKDADVPLPPASVTKIMSLLLFMEAIEAEKIHWDDMVVTSETAASMGGSQIFLKAGEEMSVEDLLKSVVVASANDACASLAEYVSGSLDAFVASMNQKAKELGMKNTHFENSNGLDDTTENHVTSARDIAIMSRELLKHEKILEFSSIWMSTVRDGAFTLTNTNRLIRFYKGATGLKTGSTAKAKFCISATAQRDGMHLIAVIMGAETRDIRNEEAKKLLDYGFANYALYRYENAVTPNVRILGGIQDFCATQAQAFSIVVPKDQVGKIKPDMEITESFSAPIQNGDIAGKIIFRFGESVLGETPIVFSENVEKISYWNLFFRMMKIFTVKG